jgi:hypothetical protein
MRTAALAMVVIGLVTGLAIYAFLQRHEALAAKVEAEGQKQEALNAEIEAEKQKQGTVTANQP